MKWFSRRSHDRRMRETYEKIAQQNASLARQSAQQEAMAFFQGSPSIDLSVLADSQGQYVGRAVGYSSPEHGLVSGVVQQIQEDGMVMILFEGTPQLYEISLQGFEFALAQRVFVLQ